jgi:type IX secretion system PorP/SprF family membrane protein
MKKPVQGILLLLCLQTNLLLAQQIQPLSNFMYNQLVYNPASAGMHDAQFNVNVLSRIQWSNIGNGSPSTGIVWSDYRLKSNKAAIGLVAGRSSYSGYKNIDLNLNYAYYINLNKRLKLAMGLRAGFTSMSFSTKNFNIWDDNDDVITNSAYNKITPKFGFGFQLNSRNSYIGLASDDFISARHVDITGDTANSFLERKRNINLMAGTKLRLGDLYNLRPNLALFYYTGNRLMAKINSTFEIRDYFWMGLTYSTNKFATINVGTNISSRIRFAYAFETNIGSITNKAKGTGLASHEINLMITLDNLFRNKK